MKRLVLILLLLLPAVVQAAKERVAFDSNDFPVCSRYGCEVVQRIGLDAETWQELTAVFDAEPKSPAMERALLAEWVGQMEVVVGRLTNTQYDVEGTFIMYTTPDRHKSMQMDCVDEAENVNVYLSLLEAEGKLRWHRINGRVHRGFFIKGYPHTAMSIQDTQTEQVYVLDSWFYENGRPAFILPLDVWKSGWKPQEETAEAP